MNKKIRVTLGISLLFIGVLLGFTMPYGKNNTQSPEKIEHLRIVPALSEASVTPYSSVPDSAGFLYEEDYIKAFYGLATTLNKTHQNTNKVDIQKTVETIDSMIEVLNHVEFKNETFYLESLYAWKDGNLTNLKNVFSELQTI